jgi:hypothetical protein
LFARVRSVAEHFHRAVTSVLARARARETSSSALHRAPQHQHSHRAPLFRLVPHYNLPRLQRVLLAYPPCAVGGAQYDGCLFGGKTVCAEMLR